jgi:hypothetical protein
MPDFTIALAIGLVIGFILGYGIRAERLSPIGATDAKTLVCWTAHPTAAPLGLKAGRLAPLAVLKQCGDAHATAKKTTCKDQARESSNGDRARCRRRNLGHKGSYFFGGIAVGGASILAFRLALSCSTAARVKAIA